MHGTLFSHRGSLGKRVSTALRQNQNTVRSKKRQHGGQQRKWAATSQDEQLLSSHIKCMLTPGLGYSSSPLPAIRLKTGAWSMVKLPKQATNEYTPTLPPTPPVCVWCENNVYVVCANPSVLCPAIAGMRGSTNHPSVAVAVVGLDVCVLLKYGTIDRVP